MARSHINFDRNEGKVKPTFSETSAIFCTMCKIFALSKYPWNEAHMGFSIKLQIAYLVLNANLAFSFGSGSQGKLPTVTET